jgi:hypothetical protein
LDTCKTTPSDFALLQDGTPLAMSRGMTTTTATSTNVWCLGQLFGSCDVVPNQIPRTDVSHIRRCIRAGLAELRGGELALTAAGRVALGR